MEQGSNDIIFDYKWIEKIKHLSASATIVIKQSPKLYQHIPNIIGHVKKKLLRKTKGYLLIEGENKQGRIQAQFDSS